MPDHGGDASDLEPVDALLGEERWQDALRALGPLRRARPKDPEVWRRQAAALRGGGDYSEATGAARLGGALDPESVAAHRMVVELDEEKDREARQRAEENRWAAELRRAALPEAVLEQEAERSGIPLEPVSRKERRRRKKEAKRAEKQRRRDAKGDGET
ncbi:MAG: hypothetical protein R2726_14715 [Acidimicrobiales bacterium]